MPLDRGAVAPRGLRVSGTLSLADVGRAASLSLLPFTQPEHRGVNVHHGQQFKR